MPSLSSRRRWRCLKLLETSKTLKQLKQSHSLLIASGLGRSPFALSRLLAFYSSLDRHSVDYAWAVFSRVERPTTACIYNTMLHALLLHDRPAAAIHVYSRMLADAVRPDHYTLPCILKACAKLIPRSLGESVHGQGIKLGLVSNLFVGNALIAFYIALNGEQAAPGKVFDEMPDRDAVSWTLAISGSAKAGDVEAARALFDKAPVKDLGVWGAMISGYVQDNCFKEGLHLFQLMQLEVPYIEPDEALLVSVLCACAHLGTLETGVWIHRLVERRRLRPTTRLWTGLIDIKNNNGSPEDDAVAWRALLNACCSHGDIKLAELAAERLLHIEHDSGAYVLLSNFYAAKGKQEEAQKVRMKMRNGAVDKKAPGCSSVQIGGVGFEFVAGEKMHPQMEEICLLLEKLNRHSDY
ncbi:hypothetical protein CDL15_Pgr009547 [Punica granatum]|uniref:Pentatricopeptide repeat-containing protein At5g66520-like n=1 Tax=Punica granatum TaxID=22663 RepID=A0A218WTD7_PUNGR|nr:hypothetical protein CDL15_Pgr009547 [Punica granatum]